MTRSGRRVRSGGACVVGSCVSAIEAGFPGHRPHARPIDDGNNQGNRPPTRRHRVDSTCAGSGSNALTRASATASTSTSHSPAAQNHKGERRDSGPPAARVSRFNAAAGSYRGRPPRTRARRGQRVLKGTKPQERRPSEDGPDAACAANKRGPTIRADDDGSARSARLGRLFRQDRAVTGQDAEAHATKRWRRRETGRGWVIRPPATPGESDGKAKEPPPTRGELESHTCRRERARVSGRPRRQRQTDRPHRIANL